MSGPYDPEKCARSILRFFNAEPDDQHPCELGCEHSAWEYVLAMFERCAEQAKETVQ